MTCYRFDGSLGSTNARCMSTKGMTLRRENSHGGKKVVCKWNGLRSLILSLKLRKIGKSQKLHEDTISLRSECAGMDANVRSSNLAGNTWIVSNLDGAASGKTKDVNSVPMNNPGKTTDVNSVSMNIPETQTITIPSTGLVFSIVDREKSGRGFRYRVKWCDEPNGFRWHDTWEPGSVLRKVGFGAACNIVDAWKASDEKSFFFFRFCSLNGHVHKIGASPRGMCAIYAVGAAADLLNIQGWNTSENIQKFYDECSSRGRPLTENGLTFVELRRYVKFVNSQQGPNSKQISIMELDKNLLGGVNGKLAKERLKSADLADGIYICAAFNSLRVSHCIAINVVAGIKYVFDEDNHSLPILSYDMQWIYGLSFLRRVSIHSNP